MVATSYNSTPFLHSLPKVRRPPTSPKPLTLNRPPPHPPWPGLGARQTLQERCCFLHGHLPNNRATRQDGTGRKESLLFDPGAKMARASVLGSDLFMPRHWLGPVEVLGSRNYIYIYMCYYTRYDSTVTTCRRHRAAILNPRPTQSWGITSKARLTEPWRYRDSKCCCISSWRCSGTLSGQHLFPESFRFLF